MPEKRNGLRSTSSTPRQPEAATSLPVVGQPVARERADAVRNRERILATAERLYAEHGPDRVSMDTIAEAAGVGKGTLYRRFADKAALAAALLDARESELQAAILAGPPPLGPGAPPAERLSAFVTAYLTYVHEHAELVALSQTASAGARLRTGAHHFWRRHCAYLLEQAASPDPQIRADCLLAALSAEMVRHWTADSPEELPRLTAALQRLARALGSPARSSTIDPEHRTAPPAGSGAT